jgi:hypothetical protein
MRPRAVCALLRSSCAARAQAAVAAKQAQVEAAVAAPADAAASVAAPYSASFGRTAISSVHAAPGKGLSLVRSLHTHAGGWQRRLGFSVQPRLRAPDCTRYCCAARAARRGARCASVVG